VPEKLPLVAVNDADEPVTPPASEDDGELVDGELVDGEDEAVLDPLGVP
jgi:hypothetical protein